MPNQRRQLAALMMVALAGAASMATSPPDTSVPSIEVSIEAAVGPFELTALQPEAAFEIRLETTTSSSAAGRLVADLAMTASDGDAEVIVSIEPFNGTGDFAAKAIRGDDTMTMSRYLNGPATLRLRMLGEGRITGAGKLTFETSVPTGTNTASSAYTLHADAI